MPFLRHRQTDNAYSFDEATGKRTSTALTFQLLYAFTSVGNEGFRIQGHSSGRSCSTPAAKYSIHWQLTHSRKCKRWSKHATEQLLALMLVLGGWFHVTMFFILRWGGYRSSVTRASSLSMAVLPMAVTANGCDQNILWLLYTGRVCFTRNGH